ncbi:YitT family protein [Heyndrickxia acidicola]|uniref:YitT family protein n=1 Tax=Heyndrickxia acidicola TaxID=209389 RepID=A0ABU6MJ47_9BACI|nr:YitT family protein [Heyndrickxia acidicola]MED1204408.1 YitT family protein [Heyndrickxia acidicola]
MKNRLKDYAILNAGIILIALHIHFFSAPNHFVFGGVSGISIILHHYAPNLPLGFILMGFETIIFIVGMLTIGVRFGLKSFYCSFSLSVFLLLLERFCPVEAPLSQDKLVQLIVGLFIDAVGLVLLFRQNASSGGTDIIAIILNKFFSVKIGTGIIMADLLIASSSFIVFGFTDGLYSVLGIFVLSLFVNYVAAQFDLSKEVTIISEKGELIRSFIVDVLNKGATIHTGRGAFTSQEKNIITTFMGRGEYIKLKKYILEVDPHAFVTVHNTSEIIGNGFKRAI